MVNGSGGLLPCKQNNGCSKITYDWRTGLKTIINLENGKYKVEHENGSNFKALRYGEDWRDLTGDGLVLALVQRIEELESQLTLTIDFQG